MSSEKPDQIQASVAAALSRLRGDLGPTGATAPKIDDHEPQAVERARPANDVRGDPFFRAIQSPQGARAPIPMTPFPRMQVPQEPVPTDAPADEPAAAESTSNIEMPEMPGRASMPDLVAMPDPRTERVEPSQSIAAAPAVAATPAAAPQPQTPSSNSPLSRVMRGQSQPIPSAPAQRDLLADLPPPPISEPLTADPDTSAMRRRRNRRLLAFAAVIVVVAIGAWLWTGSKPSTEVPVIAAETTPEKVKPADEGGLQVQNQDVQVLDPSTQTQGETVMPEPEQPITPPAATAPSETASAEQTPTVVENAAPESGQAPAPDVQPEPGTPLSETPLPALEEEAPTAAEAAPAAAAPEPAQPAQTAEAPAETTPAASETTAAQPAATEPAATEPAATEPAATQSAASEPAAATTAAEPVPAPAAAPAPAQAAQPEAPAAQEAPTQEAAVTPSAPTGNTRVQLAAGKSEASVQKEWAALQKAHPDLLGPLSLHIERVDKGASGIFYRLQAGPLADKNAAKELCASLKQKGQDCLVVAK